MSKRAVFTGWVVSLALAVVQCGGPQEGQCRSQSWQGQCRLFSLKKIAEVEFPVPHVVYETWYEPQTNPDRPNYAPPQARLEFRAAARYEVQLVEHIQQHAEAACHVAPAPDGLCSQGQVVVNVPEFDTTSVSRAPAEQGCQKVETAGEQAQAAPASTLDAVFSFDPNAGQPSERARAVAEQLAGQLKGDPSLECIALVGQVATDESPELAGDRARAVRDLLVAQGVDKRRLMIMTLMPDYGAGADRRPALAEDRTVIIKVVLESAPAAKPSNPAEP